MSEQYLLFQAKQVALALRDLPYKDESMAIAELIDNSVDASASRVDVLLEMGFVKLQQRKMKRVVRLSVADNGTGMDVETLGRALAYGGRPDGVNHIGRIGKYGMGLPTASGSQCLRFEVWTCEGGADDPILYGCVDLDSISEDSTELPKVDVGPVDDWPSLWRSRCSEEISGSRRGTIVLWSNIDRITAKQDTIYRRLSSRIGGIYRHRLDEGSLLVRIACFQDKSFKALEKFDRKILPVDPLFLMEPSFNPDQRWAHEAMFKPWAKGEAGSLENMEVYLGEHKATVSVRFSLVKPEALECQDGEQRGVPGRTVRGRFANQLKGISIVREGRELFLDRSFARMGGAYEPQNRWWGCEVSFGADADVIFGVDSQKQSAVRWSAAVDQYIDYHLEKGGLFEDFEMPDDDGDPNSHTILDLVRMVGKSLKVLRNDAKSAVNAANSSVSSVDSRGEKEGYSSSQIAIKAADAAFEGRKLIDSDRERKEMSEDDRVKGLVKYLEDFGVPNPEERAVEIVRSGSGFCFLSKPLDGFQMFDVSQTGVGVIVITLNSNHALHSCLSRLEISGGDPKDFAVALAGLRVAIIAYARTLLESDTEDRMFLGRASGSWGHVAGRVYEDLLTLLPPDMED